MIKTHHRVASFMFVDYWPVITWSMVDYDRRPKPAYTALTEAMNPCQILLDLPLDPNRVHRLQSSPCVIVNDAKSVYPPCHGSRQDRRS